MGETLANKQNEINYKRDLTCLFALIIICFFCLLVLSITLSLQVVNSSSPAVDIDTLFKDVSNTLGILILLPDDDEPEMKSRVAMQPPDAIKHLADR